MTSDKKPVDMELKKAFQELQSRMASTKQQLNISDAQIEQLKKQIIHSKFLQRELATYPEDVVAYEGIGRMFVKQPVKVIDEDLTKKASSLEEKIKSIDLSKAYLEKTLKESEDNLRELIASKQR